MVLLLVFPQNSKTKFVFSRGKTTNTDKKNQNPLEINSDFLWEIWYGWDINTEKIENSYCQMIRKFQCISSEKPS